MKKIILPIVLILGIISVLGVVSAYKLTFSTRACDSSIDPYSPPVSGILSQNWSTPNILVVDAYVKTFCGGVNITGDFNVDFTNNKIVLKYKITTGDAVTECNCAHKLIYTIDSLENRNYSVSLEDISVPTPICQPTKCDDGTMTECKIVDNLCSCSTCPPIQVCKPKFSCEGDYIPKCKLEGNKCVCESCPGIPIDMQSCLNDPNNYWDQETNSCHAGFSSDMIKYSCSDPDGGRNYYKYAHTYGFRSSYADDRDKRIRTGGSDSCLKEGQLIEHYCDKNGFIQTEYFQCPNGCKDNACVKGEPVTEKITCKFVGTNKEEQCYLAGQWGPEDEGTKFCKAGSGSCVITYSGYKGEKITWKSTCGQYQYTTQDGNDEVIYFKCEGGETNISEIQNIGFRFAYWQCHDGNEQKSEDTSSCKLSETWQKYAKDYCNNKCKGEKCGVNTFSVSQECYTDELPSTEVFSETGVLIKPKEPILDSESVLVCKDSCPLDNKCYPFGYRKGGNYCSDESKFVEQLKADKTCENNFECSSNVCVSSKCVDEGLIQKIINWFKKLFGD
ncbi:MAG: hypothetical protein Q8N99_04485 [Nanoarchaeota archaeon]|nr:hypothetical protein [Nanoarchaeota archaeon]